MTDHCRIIYILLFTWKYELTVHSIFVQCLQHWLNVKHDIPWRRHENCKDKRKNGRNVLCTFPSRKGLIWKDFFVNERWTSTERWCGVHWKTWENTNLQTLRRFHPSLSKPKPVLKSCERRASSLQCCRLAFSCMCVLFSSDSLGFRAWKSYTLDQ